MPCCSNVPIIREKCCALQMYYLELLGRQRQAETESHQLGLWGQSSVLHLSFSSKYRRCESLNESSASVWSLKLTMSNVCPVPRGVIKTIYSAPTNPNPKSSFRKTTSTSEASNCSNELTNVFAYNCNKVRKPWLQSHHTSRTE